MYVYIVEIRASKKKYIKVIDISIEVQIIQKVKLRRI